MVAMVVKWWVVLVVVVVVVVANRGGIGGRWYNSEYSMVSKLLLAYRSVTCGCVHKHVTHTHTRTHCITDNRSRRPAPRLLSYRLKSKLYLYR